MGVTGTGLALGAIGIHRREQLEMSDYLQGLNWLSSSGVAGAKELVQSALPTKAEARAIVVQLKEPQPKFKLNVEMLADRLLQDDSWFPEFNRRSKMVVGNTGDGKTRWQLHDVATFLQEHPEGHLTICDLDYGSAHEGSEPNYWFNLPKERYLRTTYEQAKDAILQEAEILRERAAEAAESSEGSAKPWQWRMLVIDEAVSLLDTAKDEGQDKVLLSAIKLLLIRGLKQRIKCDFGLQFLAVGENGISLALQKQMNVILLGSAALDAENLRRIGVTDEKEMRSRVKQLRSLPGCKYAAVVRTMGETDVRVVPHIDPSAIQITIPTDSELEQWWAEVYTTETQEWMKKLADRYVAGEIKSPLKTQICKRFGVQKFVKSDAKYAKVSEAWNQAKQSVQSGVTA